MIVDCDTHINEPLSLFDKHLEEPYRSRRPVTIKDTHGYTRVIIEGRLYPDPSLKQIHTKGIEGPKMGGVQPGATDSSKRLADLDLEGIDKQVIMRIGSLRGLSGSDSGLPVRSGRLRAVGRTVSASWSINQDLIETLGGFSFANEPSEQAELLQVAEHVIREYLGSKFGQTLEAIRTYPWGEQTWLVAEVRWVRRLRATEVAELGALIHERLGDPSVALSIRQDEVEVVSPGGAIRFELEMRRPETEAERAVMDAVGTFVEEALRGRGYAVLNRSITHLGDWYYAFFEVAGPATITPAQLERIQDGVRAAADAEVELFVRLVPETVVAASGYTTWNEVLTDFGRRTTNFYEDETRQLMQKWR